MSCNSCGAALVALDQYDAGLCATCLRGSYRKPVVVGAVTVLPRVQVVHRAHGLIEVPGWRAVTRTYTGGLGPFAETPEAAAKAVRG